MFYIQLDWNCFNIVFLFQSFPEVLHAEGGVQKWTNPTQTYFAAIGNQKKREN